jgi:hypothetical protein
MGTEPWSTRSNCIRPPCPQLRGSLRVLCTALANSAPSKGSPRSTSTMYFTTVPLDPFGGSCEPGTTR